MRTIDKEELKQLYDRDYPLWVEKNLELLKEGAYKLVDWENLLEKIEDMGRSDLKECISHLAVILEHIYKWDNFRELAGGETAGKSWMRSIRNSRRELELLFDYYASLKSKLSLELDKAWKMAVKNLQIWLEDNGYNPEDFNIPNSLSPYTYQDAVGRDLR
ncbi:MAG: DUF29 domain-containing protein [Hydrogenothermaceae bacterium]|nr:DUF29 domain-containing protein [Hydrogenothermaceae bacterium]